MTNDAIDHEARLWAQPKTVEYGFLNGTELLHLYKAEGFDSSTYQLMHKVAEIPSYGPWTTDSLETVITMCLQPDKYKGGVNRYNPWLTYQGPPPVAIYTWYANDGWSALDPVHKSYVPIQLPEILPLVGLRELNLELGDGISKTLYLTQGADYLAGDTVYYLPQSNEFYACMGKVESEYLLLELTEGELEERLLSNHKNLLPRFC